MDGKDPFLANLGNLGSFRPAMPSLFEPLSLRSVTLRNRIGVSPMCQYSSREGVANDWHLVHLGSFATGGAGLVIAEATAVTPGGRITPGCAGIWGDQHIEPLARINRFIKSQGAVPGIQLAHAGRKASAALPQDGGGHLGEADGGWPTIGPSPIPFGGNLDKAPLEATEADLAVLVENFAAAARRALAAGYELVEIHGAHGYLAHEFLSPISNHRKDRFGGGFENRIRFLVELVRAVRAVWPERLPLAVRLSCTDWVPGGWDIGQSVELARRLKDEGVDFVDCSSGGNVEHARIPVGPGYQVPFADQIRREAGIATAAVGMITDPAQADGILGEGRADLVLLGREMLRNSRWPLAAARQLKRSDQVKPPIQYARAW
jgi:2,4-dienoyl-CoA reductase-like NADH-dependent reductase (Old Yellow Enzyme family)